MTEPVVRFPSFYYDPNRVLVYAGDIEGRG